LGGSGNNHGGTGEGKGHGHSDDRNGGDRGRDGDPNDSSPGDSYPDPEPDTRKGDSSTFGISFEVQVKLYMGTSGSSSAEPLQKLDIHGKLTVQASVLHLHPNHFWGKHNTSHNKYRQILLNRS